MTKAMVYGGVFMGSLYALGALGGAARPLDGRQLPVLAAMLLGALPLPAAQDDHRDVRRQPAVLPAASAELSGPILSLRGAVVGLGLGSA